MTLSLFNYINLSNDIGPLYIRLPNISLFHDINLSNDISLLTYIRLLSSSISVCTRASIDTRHLGPQGQKPGRPLKSLNTVRNT